eukprot:SAG22_NODE_521_length_9507_cov_62.835991_4_plen_313_part_00
MDELRQQMAELGVGDVVRFSPDAKKSPLKMRDRDLFVRSVSKNGNTITYSPKKTRGTASDRSITTPDRLLLVKKAPEKRAPERKSATKKKKEKFVPDPTHLAMKDEFDILENDIIFTLEPTYDYMSAMMDQDVSRFFDPCPGDYRNGRDSAIKDGAVTSAKVATGAVTETLLATDAVVESKIKDGAVTSSKIANDAIIHTKIGDGQIRSEHLDGNAVETDAINYTRIIKNGGEYSDKFKIKATKDTSYFTDTKEKIDGTQLSRGDDIRAIVELRYIWLNNGKFGATWVALQIQQRSNSFAEIEFVDSDDDEQ